ncbi:hypothetical protein Tco_0287704 [Tanacetum coccineum]
METQAIDDQDHLVNYDNDNENDDLGYQSEEYFDEAQEEDENNHSNGNVVKRGITSLYKFRMEYGKPDGIKLSRYFDVDLTVRKLVKSAAAKMARSKSVYQHTMGRGGYTLLKVKKEMKCGQDQRRNLEVVRAIDAPSLIRRAEQLLLDVRMRSSIQKSNGLATLEKEMETRTDGKQMLHNKELPKDCYKVSIDTSLVDAACIPDVGNNGFKTVKDAVGGFFAWPKDQVVFDPKATPPSTIQMNVENKTAPKLHTKAKNIFVLVDEMQGKLRRRVFRSP